MTPVSELPFNVRPKTRKEKNKLASRACRLKKKAQHEANKIKLYGLEHEHSEFILFGIMLKFFLKLEIKILNRTFTEWHRANEANSCDEVSTTRQRRRDPTTCRKSC